MKGGGGAVWSLMWKYCISVRTLRYQGDGRVDAAEPGRGRRAGASGHGPAGFRWLRDVQGSPARGLEAGQAPLAPSPGALMGTEQDGARVPWGAPGRWCGWRPRRWALATAHWAQWRDLAPSAAASTVCPGEMRSALTVGPARALR